jgi:hypothetical protein
VGLKKSLFRFADRALSLLDSSAEVPCATEPNDSRFYWTMRNLPIEFATQNMAVIGGIGSGKTTLIQLLLQSISHRFKSDRKAPPEQLIIYDAKTEIIPILEAAGLSPKDPNFWILNPLDHRGASWAMGEAVEQPAYARTLSRILAPRDEKSNAPFFTDGASLLIKETMTGLSAIMATTWTFRDLLNALDSPESIRAIAAHNPRSEKIVSNILNDSKHAAGILSTLMTKLQDFEEVAALWHTGTSRREFRIERFIQEPGVLVLGFDAELKDALWPANRVILNAITQKILNQPDSKRQPRFWFLLDEFPAMRDIEFVSDLMNRGRSKGACVLLGAQTLSGLHAIYGKPRTEEILGDCTFKTFLQSSDPATAEWMSNVVGTIRYWEDDHSENDNGEGSATTKIQERRALNDSVFKFMPRADSGGEFHAVHVTPKGPIYTRSWAEDVFAMRWKVPERNGYDSSIERRNEVEDQYLDPWTLDESEWILGSRQEEPPSPPKLPKPEAFTPRPFPETDVPASSPSERPAPEKAKRELKMEPKPWAPADRMKTIRITGIEQTASAPAKEPRDEKTKLPAISPTKRRPLSGLDSFDGGDK